MERLSAQGGDRMYILNSDGSGLRELAVGEYPAVCRTVDDWIAHRGCWGADCCLWITHADSGERRRLTTGGGDGQPAWSPNGKQLAYISEEDDGNFRNTCLVNRRTVRAKFTLTNDAHSDDLPIWSPDGEVDRIPLGSQRQMGHLRHAPRWEQRDQGSGCRCVAAVVVGRRWPRSRRQM